MAALFKNILRHWLFSVSILIFGVILYLLFRQEVLFLEVFLGIKKGVLSHWDFSSPILYFIAYCLPDGLWYLSMLYSNDLISKNFKLPKNKSSRIINLLVIATPFILELSQWLGVIIGTFDFWDILTYVLTLIAYFIWIRKYLVAD